MRIYVTPWAHEVLKLQASLNSVPMTELMDQIAMGLPAAEVVGRDDLQVVTPLDDNADRNAAELGEPPEAGAVGPPNRNEME
jgi:hypothetical protein